MKAIIEIGSYCFLTNPKAGTDIIRALAEAHPVERHFSEVRGEYYRPEDRLRACIEMRIIRDDQFFARPQQEKRKEIPAKASPTCHGPATPA